DPAAITKFMRRVRKWDVVPGLVTVIGKGTGDQKDRMGSGDSFFPVRLTDNPWGLAPSDDRLLGGGADAPFAIGRLSITNDAEGLRYVQKLADYESSGPAAERHAVAAADNRDEGGNFHVSSDVLAQRLLSEFGFSGVTKLYHPADAVSANLADPSTWEAEYVSYSGHGSAFQLGNGSEDFMLATTAQTLTNAELPILTTLTCASGNDAIPGIRSIAGELVFSPNGVIAAIVSTGASLDAEAQTLGNALVDHLFDDAEPATVGGALRAAKADTSGSVQAFMARIYTVLGEPGVRVR
ncbi:MAG: C25 family cysteine peptidase, partial [Thiohalocapsa sp.]